MTQYLMQAFLSHFYLLEALLIPEDGNENEERERRAIYNELAHIFCLDDGSLPEIYYTESCRGDFRSIRDHAAYERLCRVLEFGRISGQQAHLTECDRRILGGKREAMTIKQEIVKQDSNMTRENIAQTLRSMAMNGNVHAMTALSYMEYHGIGVHPDRERALRRIRLAAGWNDLFGNLMGIVYDNDQADRYYDRLYTVLTGASGSCVFEHICRTRGVTGPFRKDAVAHILEKAFGMNIVSRNKYDRGYGKVAFSSLVASEDKEKLLLTRQKDAIASLSDIPFDAKGGDAPAFDESCAQQLPLTREGEVDKILRNLTVARCCPAAVYTPLLISSCDEYIAGMYTDMFTRGYANEPLFMIDASTLTEKDFIPGKENILLRGLSATGSARTVFLVTHLDQLQSELTEELQKILDTEYRRRYRLFCPNVSLDLSGVQFILLSAERTQTVTRLSRLCDTVLTERITGEEKSAVVGALFAERARCFGYAHMKMDEDTKAYLLNYDTDKVQQIVDAALCLAVYDRSERITLSMVKQVCEEQNILRQKRGFGYTGGSYA